MENSMAVANGRQVGRFEAAPATTKRLSLYWLATMYIVLTPARPQPLSRSLQHARFTPRHSGTAAGM
jgi:hypothetical protein